MKHFIFMLSVTLLFYMISDDAHAYVVKMMGLRVCFMWLMGLLNILEAHTLVEICRMLLHLPFAIMFTIFTLHIVNEDHPLALLTFLFLGMDFYHIAAFGLAMAQEVFQREAPMNYQGPCRGQ